MAPLLEQPDIEATRIVWESELEGSARELLNAAEGETAGKVPKLDMAKQFLADILASAMASGDGNRDIGAGRKCVLGVSPAGLQRNGNSKIP
jgi:hypothetical protein